jgi:transposase InsO family protein
MPKGRRLVPKEEKKREPLTPEQRLLLLDTWQRSGLPARDFSAIVGLSPHTLYGWKKRFQRYGPEGLMDRPRGGPRGSRLPEVTKRTILLLKREHPEWGCQRISDLLLRGPALPASPSAVAKVLKESGYEFEEVRTAPHPPGVRRFERERAGQLWQTDIFTFVLKRQNRRVYLVAFLDDYSRYIVGWGLHATASTALVLEVLRSAITSYGPPEEVLTDNGSQYVTWRGKSAFAKECEQRGIKQLVARPRHPQTLGKIERFWGTLWRGCVETAIFADLGEAQCRLGHFVDHYNFQRTHQGIDGLVPADRFFGAESEVRAALERRVASNALELARDGVPKDPFYLTGQVGGKGFSVHAEGERVILTPEGGERREIELVAPKEGRGDERQDSTEEDVEAGETGGTSGSAGFEDPGRQSPGAVAGGGGPGGAGGGEDTGGSGGGDRGDAEPVLRAGEPGAGGAPGGLRVEVGRPAGIAREGAGSAEEPDPAVGAGAGEIPGARPGGGPSGRADDDEAAEGDGRSGESPEA